MPRPNAIQAAQQFRRRLEAQELAAFQRMATIYGGIFRSVQDEVAALAEEIAAIDFPDREKVIKLARLNRILNQIEAQVDKFGGTVVNEITLAQRLAIESAVSNSIELIEKSLPPELPDAIRRSIRASFTILPADAIEAAAGLLDEDSPLVTLLEKNYAPAVRAQVEQHFLDGIAQGMNPRRIAILLNKNFTNSLGNGLTWAMTTVRTAQIKSYQLATHATYQANPDIVPSWIWHAQLDSRTCLSCINQHGSEHPITETLRDHHNGRCAPLPKTITFADLGLTGIKEKREPVQRGEDWFKAQPAATQRELMGAARYEAWKKGQFDFRDLSRKYTDNVYGELIREASLKDLSGKNGKISFIRPPEGPPQPPAIKTKPAPEKPSPAVPRAFPDNVSEVQTVRGLGGSTGAELVKDPQTGKLFVRKKGGSPGHLAEEIAADNAYKALGVNVPDFKIYDTPEGPVKLAEFIDGQSLKDLLNSGDTKKINAALKKINKDFGADALLGNWDVVGLDRDNILIDKKGDVWRIDNGGALRYRAQGRLKNTLGQMAQYDEYPNELWTLRDQTVNPQTAEVFGDLEYKEVLKQMKQLERKKKKLLKALPDDLKPIVEARLKTIKDVVNISETLQGDAWVDNYIDNFARHSVQMRKSGLTKQFPKKLTPSGVLVQDENGLTWDHLRGRDSIMKDLKDYMERNGGDLEIVSHWMERQAGSSWSGASQAYKYYIAQQRGGRFDDYYWNEGLQRAQQHYEGALNALGRQKYEKSLQMWHAFNREFLEATDFKRNNKRGKFVELVRTEARFILDKYGINRGDKGKIMLRGGAESASIYQTVVVGGGELTTQKVPYHRIIGNYFFERRPGSDESAFYGDRENEFVFIPEGIPFDYVEGVSAGEDTSRFW